MVCQIEKTEMVAAGVALRAGLDCFISFNFYFFRPSFLARLAIVVAAYNYFAVHLEFNF
jgi:hypothetical protein